MNGLNEILISLLTTSQKFATSIKDSNTEANLHQYRVHLRKLRSIIKEFSPHLDKSKYKSVYKKIKNILSCTNYLRDSDVFLQKLQKYYDTLPSRHKRELKALIKEVKNRRDNEQKDISKIVCDKRFQKEFKKIEETLEDSSFYTDEILNQFEQTKQLVIENLNNKVKKRRERLYINSKIEYFHSLRIFYKRQRYLNEIFFNENSQKIDKLKDIQTILGDIQDLSVQKQILKSYKDDKKLKSIVKFLLKKLAKELLEKQHVFLNISRF